MKTLLALLALPLSLKLDLVTFTQGLVNIISVLLPNPKRIMHNFRLHPVPSLQPTETDLKLPHSSARVMHEDLFVVTQCDFSGCLFDQKGKWHPFADRIIVVNF